MSKSKDLGEFCKSVDFIFKWMGGYTKSTAFLKLLLYCAFSESSILAEADIPTIRTYKNCILELLELSEDSLASDILRGTDDRTAFEDLTRLPVRYLYIENLEKSGTTWDYFPRYISKHEFLKPADCLKAFFAHKNLLDWKILVEELFSCALLKQSMFDFSDNVGNAIEIHDDLFKLLEITHIIMIRQPYVDA